MTPAEQKAVGQLSDLTSLLLAVKGIVEETKNQFESELLYYKNFRFHTDPPSIVPVQLVEEFMSKIRKYKDEVFHFKASFNENELPENLKKAFLKFFLVIGQQIPLPIKDGALMIGGQQGTWEKKVSYVLEMWKNYDYNIKVSYSFQAYNAITKYFSLVNPITVLLKPKP